MAAAGLAAAATGTCPAAPLPPAPSCCTGACPGSCAGEPGVAMLAMPCWLAVLQLSIIWRNRCCLTAVLSCRLPPAACSAACCSWLAPLAAKHGEAAAGWEAVAACQTSLCAGHQTLSDQVDFGCATPNQPYCLDYWAVQTVECSNIQPLLPARIFLAIHATRCCSIS